jgi:hypothetical protein
MLQFLGWHADMSKGKLYLACMLQDIALNSEDLIKIRSLNDPNLEMFSEEDQEQFKNHPLQAALVSNYFSGFTEVDFIISQRFKLIQPNNYFLCHDFSNKLHLKVSKHPKKQRKLLGNLSTNETYL